jgi:hypothetical protein
VKQRKGPFLFVHHLSNGEIEVTLKERTTPYSPRCTECREMVLREFSDEELKQLVAGTLSFTCTNGKGHKSGSDNCWSPTKDEKDGFVKVLLSN